MRPPLARTSVKSGRLECRIASDTARHAAFVPSSPCTSTPIPNSSTIACAATLFSSLVSQPMKLPPMTRIVSPVMYAEASDARNRHASAISSGRPSRPSGMRFNCSAPPGGAWRNSGYHSA